MNRNHHPSDDDLDTAVEYTIEDFVNIYHTAVELTSEHYQLSPLQIAQAIRVGAIVERQRVKDIKAALKSGTATFTTNN